MAEDHSTIVPLEWQFCAWESQPQKRTIALVAMVIAALAGFFILHHILFAILGAGVVFVSTAELFLPVKYRLDANEAKQRIGISITSITWNDVKRLIPQDDGIRLSPFENSNRLDAFRGLFLRFASNGDEVLCKIRELWQNNASTLERTTDSGSETGTCGEDGTSHPQT